VFGWVGAGAPRVAAGASGWIAIDRDGSTWQAGCDDVALRVMGDAIDACVKGFAIAPAKLMERVRAVAAGDSATVALDADGALWQWDAGRGPRRLVLPR
jgi:alpha-tubulin suppressor-like RCC1 family protein